MQLSQVNKWTLQSPHSNLSNVLPLSASLNFNLSYSSFGYRDILAYFP